MEITETERLMLVKDKEAICGATLQILRLVNDPKNAEIIKENLTTILSLLNQIASYADAKNSDLDAITKRVNYIFGLINLYPLKWKPAKQRFPDYWNELVVRNTENFCNIVNSIRFDFTDKKGLKIILPKVTLPKNINIGNIIHQ